MKILDDYHEALEKLYQYFGYEEGWTVFPVDDARKYYWRIDNNLLYYYLTLDEYQVDDDEDTNRNLILPNRKSIFYGQDYTAILVDTGSDGNIFFQIFDNKKCINIKNEFN